MRSSENIREQVMLLLVEEINKTNFREPENSVPHFLEEVTNKLHEFIIDELTFGKIYKR